MAFGVNAIVPVLVKVTLGLICWPYEGLVGTPLRAQVPDRVSCPETGPEAVIHATLVTGLDVGPEAALLQLSAWLATR